MFYIHEVIDNFLSYQLLKHLKKCFNTLLNRHYTKKENIQNPRTTKTINLIWKKEENIDNDGKTPVYNYK